MKPESLSRYFIGSGPLRRPVHMRLVFVCAVLCFCAAGWQAGRLIVMARWNQAIAAGEPRGDLAHAPPEVRFAAAYAAARRGAMQEALNRYRELEADAGARLRHDAMFNSGNLYLQQAASAWGGPDRAAALTLAELAKASYRELLREDSGDWDARYNLEKSLRLAPDTEADEETYYTPPTHLRAAPTAPGTNLGLP